LDPRERMRLLTHNTLRNNSASAKGKGFPLRIAAAEVRVDEDGGQVDEKSILFVKSVLTILDWSALVQVRLLLYRRSLYVFRGHTCPARSSQSRHGFHQAAIEVGIPTLPSTLTEQLASDDDFLRALYHVLMNVHVVRGSLTCPVTGRQFPIENEIPNMILQDDECESVRY
jgi:multifunctional methyltransferase subunit TRM112